MTRITPDHYSEKEFQQHLAHEHGISPFSSYLREIVYGGSDGIVTTFAVVAGFAGATGDGQFSLSIPVLAVLVFGLANLFADATSMALGNYLSLRADHDLYRANEKKERHEVKHEPHMEWTETVHILKSQGFTVDDAKKMANIYKRNPEAWVNFMMVYELDMARPESDHPVYTSLATFFSFVIFGSVPLMPYIIFSGIDAHFQLSILFTFLALVLLGLSRWKVTGVSLKRSVLEIVILGSTSAIIAYLVGLIFRI